MTHRIYTMPFSTIYDCYTKKVEKKGYTQEQVITIILWLTGYSRQELQKRLDNNIDCEQFFQQAPLLHPNRFLITGKICGVVIQDIPDSLMKEIRYLDKLIDELVKGKSMDTILRG